MCSLSLFHCYLILQVLLCDLDGVVLDSVSVPLVGDLLGNQLLQDEEQQLVVVSAEGQVASERLDRNKQHRLNKTSNPDASGTAESLLETESAGSHAPSSCSS